jgi:Tol biopolymer transport system component
MRELRAADIDAVTWGATDPAWSPDGKHLAISLFGSIWRVPVDGGIAEQISTTPGYNAHPAWSPLGDKIAWISGAPPAGAKAQVAGKLMIFDIRTGKEREQVTPNRVAGTLAWSPDGKKIATGLSVPNVGSLLHDIDLTDGTIQQLQFAPQRPRGSEWERVKIGVGAWVDTAWNPKRDELFFGAEHIGAPQIWSMPSTRPPIAIALPLSSTPPTCKTGEEITSFTVWVVRGESRRQ